MSVPYWHPVSAARLSDRDQEDRQAYEKAVDNDEEYLVNHEPFTRHPFV